MTDAEKVKLLNFVNNNEAKIPVDDQSYASNGPTYMIESDKLIKFIQEQM